MLNLFKKKQPQGTELALKIEGMHCTSCALTIDGALEDLEGIISAETSYAKGQIKVQYDPKKATKETIIQTIQEQGYSVA